MYFEKFLTSNIQEVITRFPNVTLNSIWTFHNLQNFQKNDPEFSLVFQKKKEKKI